MSKERGLTSEESSDISQAIENARQEDDRDPSEVIQDSYDGDSARYMKDMATWHNVPIGLDRILLKLKALTAIAGFKQEDALLLIADCDQEEIGILLTKLEAMEKRAQGKAVKDTTDIVETARASNQFSPEGLPSGMADFYDNEVSSVHVGVGQEITKIRRVVNFLTEARDALAKKA